MPITTEADDYLFEEEAAEFDPLQDLVFDDDDDDDVLESTLDDGPYNLPDPDKAVQFKGSFVSFAGKDTAEERLEALFDQMPTLHHMLFAILGACQQPIADAQLCEVIAAMKEHHHCIYSPANFCDLLTKASAIAKTDAEGNSLEDVVQEPLVVEIDGVEYWEVAPAPEVFWQLTSTGRAKFDTYRPIERIRECYENEPQYAEILTTVLQLCAQEGGSSMKQIGDVIDDEPILQSPKRYAMYFIDKLEHAGGVEWLGAWTATEAGRTYLEEAAKEGGE